MQLDFYCNAVINQIWLIDQRGIRGAHHPLCSAGYQ